MGAKIIPGTGSNIEDMNTRVGLRHEGDSEVGCAKGKKEATLAEIR